MIICNALDQKEVKEFATRAGKEGKIATRFGSPT
jgi:hypothetical protein